MCITVSLTLLYVPPLKRKKENFPPKFVLCSVSLIQCALRLQTELYHLGESSIKFFFSNFFVCTSFLDCVFLSQ